MEVIRDPGACHSSGISALFAGNSGEYGVCFRESFGHVSQRISRVRQPQRIGCTGQSLVHFRSGFDQAGVGIALITLCLMALPALVFRLAINDSHAPRFRHDVARPVIR
jgi:hypothetical protein